MKLKSVVLTEVVPLHYHRPGTPCDGWPCGFDWSIGTAIAHYRVDLETGVCSGHVQGDAVQVDPVWWEAHLARVGERVRASFKDHVVS
jgi:hypothetical protein